MNSPPQRAEPTDACSQLLPRPGRPHPHSPPCTLSGLPAVSSTHHVGADATSSQGSSPAWNNLPLPAPSTWLTVTHPPGLSLNVTCSEAYMSPDPVRPHGLCCGPRQWPVTLPSPHQVSSGITAALAPHTGSAQNECPLLGARWYIKGRVYLHRRLLPTPPQSTNSLKPRTVTSSSLDRRGACHRSQTEKVFRTRLRKNWKKTKLHIKALGT